MANSDVLTISPDLLANIRGEGSRNAREVWTTTARNVIAGVDPTQWFGPLNPIQPFAPDSVGVRSWDYPVGLNIRYQPRKDVVDELKTATFQELRFFAQTVDVLRILIETRKDQLSSYPWAFRYRDESKSDKDDPKIKYYTEFFRHPDPIRRLNFRQWTRKIVDDMLTVDAPAIYIHRSINGKKILGLIPIDGTTIKPLITSQGQQPEPPSPAYQQVLHGVPVSYLSTDDLCYFPRNRPTYSLYGYGPVEQMLTTLNLIARRQIYQIQYYTEANTPIGFLSAPQNYAEPQIAQLQQHIDNRLTGNTAERRHVLVLPYGTQYHDLKPEMLTDKFDQFIFQLACACFSVSPQVFMFGNMNRASAGQASTDMKEEGLFPLLMYLKDLFDHLLEFYFGESDIEFVWAPVADEDPMQQDLIEKNQVITGRKTINELRAKHGDDAFEGGDEPFIQNGGTIVLVRDLPMQSIEAKQQSQLDMMDRTAEVQAKHATDPGNDPSGGPAAGKPGGPALETTASKPKPKDGKKKPGDKSSDAKKLAIVKKKAPSVRSTPFSSTKGAHQSLTRVTLVLERFFKQQAPIIGAQLVHAYAKYAKVMGEEEISGYGEDPKYFAKEPLTPAIARFLKAKSTVDKILDDLDFSGWHILTSEMEPEIEDTVKAAGYEALQTLGIDDTDITSQLDERASDFATERGAELVGMKYNDDGVLVENDNPEWAITDGTREWLRGLVSEAVDGGWAAQELADKIGEDYAFSASRALMVGRTELARAHSYGNLQGWKESGVVAKKKWVTAKDACDLCQDNEDEGEIDIEDDFPSGDDSPPGHPNCECAMEGVTDYAAANEEPAEEESAEDEDVAAMMKGDDFDEGKHPRDSHGRFGSGASGDDPAVATHDRSDLTPQTSEVAPKPAHDATTEKVQTLAIGERWTDGHGNTWTILGHQGKEQIVRNQDNELRRVDFKGGKPQYYYSDKIPKSYLSPQDLINEKLISLADKDISTPAKYDKFLNAKAKLLGREDEMNKMLKGQDSKGIYQLGLYLQDYDLNAALRDTSNKLSKEDAKNTKLAVTALSKLPAFEGTSHRGIFMDSEADAKAFAERNSAGKTLVDPAFASSSVDKSVAEGFAKGVSYQGIKTNKQWGVLMEIAGRSGRDVSLLDPFMRDEKEILFSPNTRFKVKSVERDSKARLYRMKVKEI